MSGLGERIRSTSLGIAETDNSRARSVAIVPIGAARPKALQFNEFRQSPSACIAEEGDMHGTDQTDLTPPPSELQIRP